MVLKSLFGGGTADREPTLRDREQILAWLEELARLRTPLALRVKEEDPHGSTVKAELVSEEKGTFTLSFLHQPSGEWKAGMTLHLSFPLDGQRFRTTMKYKGLGGYLQREFQLPEAILHAERRGLMRSRFSAREKATVTVLEGLFDGFGLSGPVVNLGIGGVAFRVDRAMDIKLDRRLQIRGDLLPPGRKLALVRLQELSHTPTLECSATLVHIGPHGDGIVAGLCFEGLGSLESQYLAKLLSLRIPLFGRGFPRKRRRGELDEGAEQLGPEDEESPYEEPQPPTEAELALSDAELTDLHEAIHAPNRLQILRKRSRRILVVHPEELDRAMLLATLQVDGYRGLLEARSLVQALELTRQNALDLLIVWHKVGPHEGLELIAKLREAFRGEALPAVLLVEALDVKHKLALKGGKLEGAVTHPVDYDGILKPLLEKILALS